MKKSIIDEICLNNTILRKRSFSKEYEELSDEAYKLYVQLTDILNDEQKKIFNQYIDTHMCACAEDELVHFKEGFKTGLLLAIECL